MEEIGQSNRHRAKREHDCAHELDLASKLNPTIDHGCLESDSVTATRKLCIEQNPNLNRLRPKAKHPLLQAMAAAQERTFPSFAKLEIRIMFYCSKILSPLH